MQTMGLLAAGPIRVFLDREPDVRRSVAAFARDDGPEFLVVAGPPTRDEVMRHHALPRRLRARNAIELPVVRLNFRKVEHHLTHEKGIEVSCTADDLDRLVDWNMQHAARRLSA
jgi:hypothetical protein